MRAITELSREAHKNFFCCFDDDFVVIIIELIAADFLPELITIKLVLSIKYSYVVALVSLPWFFAVARMRDRCLPLIHL